MRVNRGRFGVALTILSLSCAVLAGPGNAGANADGCGEVTLPHGEFFVAKLTVPDGGGTNLGLGWSIKDPVPPTVDDETYSTSLVLAVLTAGGSVRGYVLDVTSSGAPRMIVRSNGTSYAEESVPVPWRTGIHGSEETFTTGSISGVNYVVAYGTGPREGLLSATGPGRWTIGVSASGATCEVLDAPGEIVDYNQTHFSGPTNIYAPSAGVGQNLKLNTAVTRDLAVGFLHAASQGGTSASVDLRWTFPNQERVGTISGDALKPFFQPRGPQSFALDYAGVDPIARLNFLQVDLP